MRTFIALVPPPHVTDSLAEIGAQIRRIDSSLRCEPREKLHFTLEFLGEKTEDWIDECRRSLEAAIRTTAPFPVTIHRVGFFPGHTHPRIIWAGSQPEENEPLCRLASEIKRVCVQLGHKADPKPFHPHITLTRIKSAANPAAIERIAALGIEPFGFECGAVSMIKSTLQKSGSKYELLSTIALHAANNPG